MKNKEILNSIKFFKLKDNFSYSELKKSYKEKCRELHPDCGGNKEDFHNAVNHYERLCSYLEEIKNLDKEDEKDIVCPACPKNTKTFYSFCYHCNNNGYTRSIKKNSNGIPISLSKEYDGST